MNHQEKFLSQKLKELQNEGRYRTFRTVARTCGNFPQATYFSAQGEKEITIWCSNDYLGMGQNPVVLNAMHQTIDAFGAGAGGTRNISGTHSLIVELEAEIASVQNKEAALVFTSGYIANETPLATIGNLLPNCVFLSDSDNHASMIEGIRRSKADKKVFRHNDPGHLRELLQSIPAAANKVVVFESLYSMDGDFAPCEELIAVAKEFDALIFVDETHAVGVYGNEGGGILQARGLSHLVDIIQGGLGKGIGMVGGFIAASAVIVDAVRSFGAGFIFTTTLPPVIASGALASIRYLRTSDAERIQLFERVAIAREAIKKTGLPLLHTTSQILPLIVGSSVKCKMVADELLESCGCYVQPINFPTVPRGSERLRITPSPLHTREMSQHFADSLASVSHLFKLQSAA